MSGLKEVGDSVITAVKAYVARAVADVSKRVDDLSERLKAIPAGPQGERGEKGEPGQPGAAGVNGRSAYQSAVERGFQGTELQWLDSIAGRPGKDADPTELRAMRESIERRASARMVEEMVDEIAKGLGGFDTTAEATPQPALSELAGAVKSLEQTLREPLKPVYDDEGELQEVRR